MRRCGMLDVQVSGLPSRDGPKLTFTSAWENDGLRDSLSVSRPQII